MTLSPGLDVLLETISKDIEKELYRMSNELQKELLKTLSQRFNTDLRGIQKTLQDILRLQQNRQTSVLNEALQSSIDRHFGNNMVGALLNGIVSQNTSGTASHTITSNQQKLTRQTLQQTMLAIGRSIAKSQQRNG